MAFTFIDRAPAARMAILLSGAFGLFCLAGDPALAQDWTGANSNDWFDAGNWSTNTVPTGSDPATLDTNVPNAPVIEGGSASTNVLTVGDSASGNALLTIRNGGTLTSASGAVGYDPGAIGSVVIEDGSAALSTGNFYVGYGGSGSLSIFNGGSVSSASASVGEGTGSTGSAIINGAGSEWETSFTFTVGTSGFGTMVVRNGGTITAVDSYIGYNGSGIGETYVESAGSWNSSAALSVGYDGGAFLLVRDGGVVTSQDGYIGRNAGSTGAVGIEDANSLWDVNGSLFVGYDGTGELNISDGAEVQAGIVSVAANAGSTGTLNIGGGASAPAAAPGALNTTSVALGNGTATINFNHTGAAYAFDAAISGPGTINHLAGTTIFNNVSNTMFSGNTFVTGGTMVVNGSFAGSFQTVSNDGTIGGTGILGGLTVQAGGTVAPGDPTGSSIGNLNLAGNLVFDPGSFYQVEVGTNGSFDTLRPAGSATLAGTVQVLAGGAGAASATPYAILTASSALNGQFDNVTSNLAFLDPTLSYDTFNVYLTLTNNGTSFGTFAETPNQREAAGGAEALGAGNEVYDAVLGLSTNEAPDAFDALSGEIHASLAPVLIDQAQAVRSSVATRLQGLGATGSARQFAALDADQLVLGEESDASGEGTAIWLQPLGGFGEVDGDGNAAEMEYGGGGFLVGADHGWTLSESASLRAGLAAGYTRSDIDVSDRRSTASLDSAHVIAYGGVALGPVDLRLAGGATWSDADTKRHVEFSGFSETERASYDIWTTQAVAEFAYRLTAGHATLQPFANLAYVNADADGFKETGGSAALSSDGDSFDSLASTIGLRVGTSVTFGDLAPIALSGSLGWRHGFGDLTPTTDLAFRDGDSSFQIDGVPMDRDSVLAGLNAAMQITPASQIGLSYSGAVGADALANAFMLDFDLRF